MNTRELGSILNRLHHAEMRSLISSLARAGVFVSWASASGSLLFKKIIAEERDARRWLVELIDEIGEAPTPHQPDGSTTGLHYVDLELFLPLVVADKRRLLARYAELSGKLAFHADAGDLARRIVARHQEHIAQLEKLASPPASADTPAA